MDRAAKPEWLSEFVAALQSTRVPASRISAAVGKDLHHRSAGFFRGELYRTTFQVRPLTTGWIVFASYQAYDPIEREWRVSFRAFCASSEGIVSSATIPGLVRARTVQHSLGPSEITEYLGAPSSEFLAVHDPTSRDLPRDLAAAITFAASRGDYASDRDGYLRFDLGRIGTGPQ